MCPGICKELKAKNSKQESNGKDKLKPLIQLKQASGCKIQSV